SVALAPARRLRRAPRPPPAAQTEAQKPPQPAPPAQADAAAGESPPLLQLPRDVKPVRYSITMEIDPKKTRFRGSEDISVELSRPRSAVWLHGRNLHVSVATVGGIPATFEQVNPEGLARLALSRPAAPGETTIHLEWDAAFDRQIVGLYLAREAEESYAYTQFEAVDARRAFPGFDEPDFKTPFEVSLVVPDSDVAVANTSPVEEVPAGEGRKRVKFAPTKPLPTYLLIWAVGPFDVVTPPPLPPNDLRKTPLQVRGIAPHGRGAELSYALATGAEELQILERYFGIPYPFEKLDHIAAPDYTYGAMENAGGILYREEILLFKPGAAGEQTKSAIASVMAHEMAHQWFGDLVTLRWWTDAWLNESFATWMGTRTVEEWNPSMQQGLTLLVRAQEAMDVDALKSARAVRQPLDDIKNVWNQFDGITYQKGGSVLAMFERFLGKETFRKGIHDYLVAHAYGGGDTDDLLEALSHAAGRDVKAAFHTFLDRPGVPLVEAKMACEGGKGRLSLTQTRYRPLGSETSAQEEPALPATGGGRRPEHTTAVWQIPVCARYASNGAEREACTIVAGPTAELNLQGCPDWVVPNADAAGYYRWSVPGTDLRKLTGAAYPKLTVRERVSLADNVRAAMRSGTISFADGMAALSPMAADPDPHLAVAPMVLFETARDHLLPAQARGEVDQAARDLYRPVARRLGWHPAKGEPSPARTFRAKLFTFLAFEAHDRELLAEGSRLGRAYAGVADGRFHPEAVDAGLATFALSAAVREGGPKIYDALQARLDKTPDAVSRRRILSALAATDDPRLLQRTLALPLDPRLRKNEREFVFEEVQKHSESRQAAWEALRSEIDQLLSEVPESHAQRLLALAGEFCDEQHLAEARDFFGPRAANMPGGARQLAEALDKVRQCIAFRDAQAGSAADFFGRKRTALKR
ncbi:MAG: M1 family metallopeptidase, partial [Myxococcales bacterium]